MKKSPATLLALPLVATMLLVGCGGDGQPDASPSSTAISSPTTAVAPTPSASPTTTASANPTTDPAIPAAARAHTPAGAEAFVKYFFERMNDAWTGPRTGTLSPLCQASSKACAAYEKTAVRLTKEGHRYDGNPVTIKFIGVVDATDPESYDVHVTLVQESRSEIDATGKVYVTDKRKDFKANVELAYVGQAWTVATIKIIK